MNETDPEKLALLYERFKDVCLVEKEVWREIFMPRDAGKGLVLTRVQDRYEVLIDDETVESALEANIQLGGKSLAAAIQEYPGDTGFQSSNGLVTLSGVAFRGYIFANTSYDGGGGSTILGAIQFGSGVASTDFNGDGDAASCCGPTPVGLVWIISNENLRAHFPFVFHLLGKWLSFLLRN